jgi:DNA polymerase III epsilon subunit-like protein
MVDTEGIFLDEALIQFLAFIEDLPLVTFNASFDMGFLNCAARLHGMTIQNPYTCALLRARQAFPALPSHKLTYLAEVPKLPDTDTHRALGDCVRTLHVFAISTAILQEKPEWTSNITTVLSPITAATESPTAV